MVITLRVRIIFARPIKHSHQYVAKITGLGMVTIHSGNKEIILEHSIPITFWFYSGFLYVTVRWPGNCQTDREQAKKKHAVSEPAPCFS